MLIPSQPANLRLIWANRAVFAILGLCAATTAPMIPDLKDRLKIREDTLGIVLLMLGIGSVASMPFVGRLVALKGHRFILVASSISIAIFTVGTSVVSSLAWAILNYLLLGASMGALDVAMNLHATEVEKQENRPLMSGFHGFYSLRGLTGTLIVTLLLKLTGSFVAMVVAIAAICWMLIFSCFRYLLNETTTSLSHGGAEHRLKWNHPVVLALGLICGITFAAEGSVSDWSGLVLRSKALTEESWLGLGYGAFAATMTLGRLTGDRLREKLGDRRLAILGSAICASGFLMVSVLSSFGWIVIGFGMVGLGASNIVPIMFSASSRVEGVPSEVGVSTVTIMGYAGFLICPPLLGFVAKSLSISQSMGLVAFSMMVVLCMVPRLIGRESIHRSEVAVGKEA